MLVVGETERPRRRAARGSVPAGRTTVTVAPDLVLDLRMRLVTVSGRQVRLTSIEMLLLLELARHRGVMVHRSTLEQAVWGRSVPPSSRRLQMAVSRLRSKIGYHRIATIRDWGYTLTNWQS